MSRVGKKPIPLPAGVTVEISGGLEVKGPKGVLKVPVPAGIRVAKDGNQLVVTRDGDQYAALHGLTRALASNAVVGTSAGWTRELDITGIGYRCDLRGDVLMFSLGYSHPIEYMLPAGVTARVDKQTHIVLMSHDRELLGQVAANMRALRKPDPYKNKGIRYTGEKLRKKVGKTGAGGK